MKNECLDTILKSKPSVSAEKKIQLYTFLKLNRELKTGTSGSSSYSSKRAAIRQKSKSGGNYELEPSSLHKEDHHT